MSWSFTLTCSPSRMSALRLSVLFRRRIELFARMDYAHACVLLALVGPIHRKVYSKLHNLYRTGFLVTIPNRKEPAIILAFRGRWTSLTSISGLCVMGCVLKTEKTCLMCRTLSSQPHPFTPFVDWLYSHSVY